MSAPQVVGLVTALALLLLLLELLRRRRLREKYALVWSVLALISLVGAAAPSLLYKLTDLVGFELPVNLIFFIAFLVLFALSVQFSLELGRQEERVRTLAEELAILRLEIEQSNAHEVSDDEPPVDEV
jgi:hypothetical protein